MIFSCLWRYLSHNPLYCPYFYLNICPSINSSTLLSYFSCFSFSISSILRYSYFRYYTYLFTSNTFIRELSILRRKCLSQISLLHFLYLKSALVCENTILLNCCTRMHPWNSQRPIMTKIYIQVIIRETKKKPFSYQMKI